MKTFLTKALLFIANNINDITIIGLSSMLMRYVSTVSITLLSVVILCSVLNVLIKQINKNG